LWKAFLLFLIRLNAQATGASRVALGDTLNLSIGCAQLSDEDVNTSGES
jgi:hypothetical protein